MEINNVGWKLAEYEGSGSYQALIANIYNQKTGDTNDNGIQHSPLSFLRGGFYINGNPDNRGSYGHYWESKTYSETRARLLRFYSTLLNPQFNYNKDFGFSIRCVVR